LDIAVGHNKQKGDIDGKKETVCSSRHFIYYDFIRAWRMFNGKLWQARVRQSNQALF
jgi:hypothetical protein